MQGRPDRSLVRLIPLYRASVIARSEATKESSLVVQKLDCFAALAMTTESAHSRHAAITHAVIACDKREAFALGARRGSNQLVVQKLDCFAALAMTAFAVIPLNCGGRAHERRVA